MILKHRFSTVLNVIEASYHRAIARFLYNLKQTTIKPSVPGFFYPLQTALKHLVGISGLSAAYTAEKALLSIEHLKRERGIYKTLFKSSLYQVVREPKSI